MGKNTIKIISRTILLGLVFGAIAMVGSYFHTGKIDWEMMGIVGMLGLYLGIQSHMMPVGIRRFRRGVTL